MKALYINPYTDFGFKKIFGEEASKPLLIDFLNALLPEKHPIIDVVFKNTEHLGTHDGDRKAIYDIYCENEKGEKFIVELQKAKQNFFKERTIFYSTFPIREQAEKGEWNYRLKAVYCIGILDFTFDDYEDEPYRNEVVHIVQLKNQHGKVFYDKLTYIYLEMPNFKLAVRELKTRLDKWLYFFKNLEDFQSVPTIFQDDVFEKAFEKAKLANLSVLDMDKYEQSLKTYRDLKNVVDTAYDEGKEEGREEGRQEGRLEGRLEEKLAIAKLLLSKGMTSGEIQDITGLSEAEIQGINQDKP